MERPSTDTKPDIVDEPYKGPGAFITGVGEGAVAHYGFAFGGMLLAGIATFIFHKPVGNLVEKIRTGAHGWQNNAAEGIASATKRQLGKFGNSVFGTGVTNEHKAARDAVRHLGSEVRGALEKTISIREHGFGQWLLMHTVGLVPAGKKMLQQHVDPRVTNSIAVGGIAGFAGFILSPIYFMFSGAKHANDGRLQFEQAKGEIITTRGERDALLQQYAQMKTELDTLKTAKPEAAPRIVADAPAVEPVLETAIKATPKVDHGDAVNIVRPKIEGVPIQSPPVESPIPRNQWWDGKEGASHAERVTARDDQALQTAANR